jgi:ABC-2 type transport system permease protein
MRLLRVELSRLVSRRAVVLIILGAALLTALVAGSTIWETRPVSATDLAQARAQVQEVLSQPDFQRDLQTCRDSPEDFFGPGADESDCEVNLVPRPENYLNRSALDLDEQQRGAGVAVVVLVAALMIIVGTTFAGADWATGSMSNQLLFEPRRLRVWGAKAVTVFVTCGVVAAVLLAGFWVALALVAQARDIGTATTVRDQIGWTALRGVVLAACGGLGGYALTMLLRHTVGTLALLFAYAAGGEALLTLVPLDGSSRFSPTYNVFAWLRDGVRVYDQSVACRPGQGPSCDQRLSIGLLDGATYLGVLLVVTLVVSALVFRRRDVP